MDVERRRQLDINGALSLDLDESAAAVHARPRGILLRGFYGPHILLRFENSHFWAKYDVSTCKIGQLRSLEFLRPLLGLPPDNRAERLTIEFSGGRCFIPAKVQGTASRVHWCFLDDLQLPDRELMEKMGVQFVVVPAVGEITQISASKTIVVAGTGTRISFICLETGRFLTALNTQTFFSDTFWVDETMLCLSRRHSITLIDFLGRSSEATQGILPLPISSMQLALLVYDRETRKKSIQTVSIPPLTLQKALLQLFGAKWMEETSITSLAGKSSDHSLRPSTHVISKSKLQPVVYPQFLKEWDATWTNPIPFVAFMDEQEACTIPLPLPRPGHRRLTGALAAIQQTQGTPLAPQLLEQYSGVTEAIAFVCAKAADTAEDSRTYFPISDKRALWAFLEAGKRGKLSIDLSKLQESVLGKQ